MDNGRSEAGVNIPDILTLGCLPMTMLSVIFRLREYLTMAEKEASEPQHFS